MTDVDCVLGIRDDKIEGDEKYVLEKTKEIKQTLENYGLSMPLTISQVTPNGYGALCWISRRSGGNACTHCIYNGNIDLAAAEKIGAEVEAVLKDSVSA